MKILLLYATNSGGTFQASQTIESILIQHGHTVDVKTPLDIDPQTLSTFDFVILGSPSWDLEDKEGQPHEDFVTFMKKCEAIKLPNLKFAVFGLGDTYYQHFCGAVSILENFVKDKEGELIVPSLKIDGYYANLDSSTILLNDWTSKLVKTLLPG